MSQVGILHSVWDECLAFPNGDRVMSRVLHGFLQNVLLSSRRLSPRQSTTLARACSKKNQERSRRRGLATAVTAGPKLYVRAAEGIMACAVGCATSLLAATPASADTPLSREFTGTGMHAYHAGEYQRSIDDLTAAIEAGSQDPRSYYFRALALLQQGREDEAVADMQEGALLESSGPGSIVVGRSLERIQGRPRLTLEQYRRRALIEQQARDQRRIEQRYTDLIESEPERLRQRRPAPFMPPSESDAPKPRPAVPATAPATGGQPDDGSPPQTPADTTPADEGGIFDFFGDPPADTRGQNGGSKK
jgi:tetratricopeptide (TPR) repeat protein